MRPFNIAVDIAAAAVVVAVDTPFATAGKFFPARSAVSPGAQTVGPAGVESAPAAPAVAADADVPVAFAAVAAAGTAGAVGNLSGVAVADVRVFAHVFVDPASPGRTHQPAPRLRHSR